MTLKLFSAIAIFALSIPAQAAVTIPFADIPNTAVVYYDVSGATAAEIRQSIDAARPRDPNDGEGADGLTSWEFNVSWQTDERGKCVAGPDDLHFSAAVKVPRLAGDSAPPELRARFEIYLQSLLQHEDGHVRNAWDHRGEIAAAINKAGCDGAAKAAQRATNAIAAQDIAYDRATDHGRTTIVPF